MIDTKELADKIEQATNLMTGQCPGNDWREEKAEFVDGNWCHTARPDVIEYHGFANPRKWRPTDEDWKLPENWMEIVRDGLKELVDRSRSLRLYMDICVRCGACADKCHFFLGTGDPKNMPVLRAELVRALWRGEFTVAGKLLGKLGGGRKLTEEVVKEWFMYFYQCTECRRCSVFCPYGIDTAEFTIMVRELLQRLGVNINWIMEPAANCNRTGNHLGIEPHTFKDVILGLCEDIEDVTGLEIEPTFNRVGAEVLFITPSGDVFAEPGIYTMMGYLLLFEHIGLDYTISTYASEGGNFGLFTAHDTMKKINAKMYHEAERLGVKWILGGECGHMWRVVHQYMETMNGPANFLEVPKSPITGTVFHHAAQTKMVHISEFTADLIKHNKLKLDPKRNAGKHITWHDSCNTARAMGLMEEPRYILNHVVEEFTEMPENTIREKTFCCGSGSGLNTNEYMDIRMRGGLARASAVKYVHETNGVNTMACVCAIDRATLSAAMDYWVPDVEVCGLSELVGNALIMEGEGPRTMDLREEDIPGMELEEEEDE